jgi:hypothetical protein
MDCGQLGIAIGGSHGIGRDRWSRKSVHILIHVDMHVDAIVTFCRAR